MITPSHRFDLSARLTRIGFLWTGLAGALSCASAGGGGASRPLSFEEALAGDSTSFQPVRGYRALAEPEWSRGGAVARPLAGTTWQLSDDCALRFDAQEDALASREGAALPTMRIAGDGCHGRSGFWQQAGGRAFWWIGLGPQWSAEYYAELEGDSSMTVRRYALRAQGAREWRVERAALSATRATRVPVALGAARPRTSEVTRALRAVGETDWATRPGAGALRAVAGSRWADQNGCVLVFGTEMLARASSSQRLTRALSSASCGGLRGSWQQTGKRVFWRVNVDSLTAGETYANLVGDTELRTRHYALTRTSPRGEWQATWLPAEARTLRRARR